MLLLLPVMSRQTSTPTQRLFLANPCHTQMALACRTERPVSGTSGDVRCVTLANRVSVSDRRFLRILVTGFAQRGGDNNYCSSRQDYCSDSDGDAVAEECCQQSCEQGAE